MLQGKLFNLLGLALAVLLVMALWFSASAVLPQLILAWHLDAASQSWMTMSVQLGFVAGALVSATLNLPDRYDLARLIGISAIAGAAANAAIVLLEPDVPGVLALRFATGACLAGVYPPGMKLVATWTKSDRGLWVGVLIGALTLGSAAPHLFNGLNLFGGRGMPPWTHVLLASSVLAVCGGLIAFGLRPGAHLGDVAPFEWRYAVRAWRNRPVRLANYGYLGHMWELYAMWTWVPLFIIASYEASGWTMQSARLAAFAAIGIGAAGCVLAGILADRLGRTTITIASLAVSGSCALAAGLVFDHPALLTALCLLWGFAVVADSAQFSAAVSELADPRYVGTNLTLQTSIGFLLTLLTIQLMPPLVDRVGWQYAFMMLAIGPLFGIRSMLRLRRLPEAAAMASGHR
ncbi:MAG: MFS transporter [Gammaproteobacteria bacterium]|nr:MFS transporter [Gammaproteobacteria bacterium]